MSVTLLAAPWALALALSPLPALALLCRVRERGLARACVAFSSSMTLALAVGLLAWAWLEPGRQRVWADPILAGSLGFDLLSASACALVGALGLIGALGAGREECAPGRLQGLLLLQSSTLLAFLARDTRLFVAASAALALTLTGALWAQGARRLALSVGLVQGLGLAFLGAGLGGAHAGEASWGWGALAGAGPASLLLLLGAVTARQALWPLHTWVPALCNRGGSALTLLTLGPGLGFYLSLRVLEAHPPGQEDFASWLLLLASVSAVYGALLGPVQRELRRGLGWLQLSLSGLILAGAAAHGLLGRSGALLVWWNAALALGGLLAIATSLEARFGRLDLARGQGLAQQTPLLARAFLLLGLASVGLPGSLGFAGEDLLFHGVLEVAPAAGAALVLATALNGWSLLRAHYRTFHASRAPLPRLPDALPRERALVAALVAALLLGGLAPAPWVGGSARLAEDLAPAIARHGPPGAR